MRAIRILVRVVLGVAAAGALAWGGLYLSHRHLLRGEPMDDAPPELSLAETFPRADGWSPERIELARSHAETFSTTAVVAIVDGRLVAEWGATDRRISGHSVRKSLISALYGTAADRGLLDVERTLADLGFDDDPPLTDGERSARILDLLTARSGVYHSSVKADTESGTPERGAHDPDEYWFYNNWSFNALGLMFEELTGMALGDAFEEFIAGPIGMQDFRSEDVRWFEGEESRYPAYRIWISARDLARVGWLFLNEGRWEERQVLSADWVRRSTAMVTDFEDGRDRGYGYMWWTLGDGRYLATGTGGQKLLVDPATRLVLVNRVDTSEGLGRAIWWTNGPRVINTQLFELEAMLLSARP